MSDGRDVPPMNAQQRRLAKRAAKRAAAAEDAGTSDLSENPAAAAKSGAAAAAAAAALPKKKDTASDSSASGNFDIRIECQMCRKMFTFPAGEAEFFKTKGWANPSRCKPCQKARKRQVDNPSSSVAHSNAGGAASGAGEAGGGGDAPPKKRKGKRSKQKNIKKDNRPDHLKPTYLTPGSADYVQKKPAWSAKDQRKNQHPTRAGSSRGGISSDSAGPVVSAEEATAVGDAWSQAI
jgi:hypothetical protein